MQLTISSDGYKKEAESYKALLEMKDDELSIPELWKKRHREFDNIVNSNREECSILRKQLETRDGDVMRDMKAPAAEVASLRKIQEAHEDQLAEMNELWRNERRRIMEERDAGEERLQLLQYELQSK